MKRNIILVTLTILAITSLACSIGLPFESVKTIDTQVMEIKESHSSGSPVSLTLAMGAGKFSLQPGAENLVEGTIRYNVTEFKPVIERGVASLSITQQVDFKKVPLDLNNTINEWDLKLGAKPMELTINGGAYDASFDLSGLALQKLNINEGASNTDVNFSKPNPETMESFSYQTGASQVKIVGLGNANIKEMKFSSGAGSYTLDFSGTLQQDVNVVISSAVSEVTIIVPEGVHCVVDVSEGVSNVDIQGTWTNRDQVYSTPGDGYTITIKIQMGLGNVVLIQE